MCLSEEGKQAIHPHSVALILHVYSTFHIELSLPEAYMAAWVVVICDIIAVLNKHILCEACRPCLMAWLRGLVGPMASQPFEPLTLASLAP